MKKTIKTKKIKVGILFGGRSVEHEVSLCSARNIIEAIDRKKYKPVLIGIDKRGKWFLFKEESSFLFNIDNPKIIKLNINVGKEIILLPLGQGKIMETPSSRIIEKIDVVFPVLHGMFGEDGTIQGLLKLVKIPFVGASVLGSAIGMDKEIAKRLLCEANIPTAKFLVFQEGDKLDYNQIVKKVGRPFFVKPANSGSSVGINKVKSKSEFNKTIKEAFKYDFKILIEELVKGREAECSVLGNKNPIVSLPGEIIPQHEFYSYEAKYLDENGAILIIPAKLSKNIVNKVQHLAIKTFKTLLCEGMARVDFFIRENGQVVVNEINTIPGFTSISMYPKLWQVSGISYPKLIDRLIQLGFERFKKEKKIKVSY